MAPPPEETDAPDTGRDRLDRVTELLREPTLLPLLLVAMIHGAAFVAWSLALLVQDGRVSAAGALLGMGALSFGAVRWEVTGRRRPGVVSLVVVGTWVLGVGLSWVASHYDVI